VNSAYRPATRKLGPNASAAIVVARSPPAGFAAIVAAPTRPLMANPPPSQPAAAAAWAGRYRANVARPRAYAEHANRDDQPDRSTEIDRADDDEAIEQGNQCEPHVIDAGGLPAIRMVVVVLAISLRRAISPA